MCSTHSGSAFLPFWAYFRVCVSVAVFVSGVVVQDFKTTFERYKVGEGLDLQVLTSTFVEVSKRLHQMLMCWMSLPNRRIRAGSVRGLQRTLGLTLHETAKQNLFCVVSSKFGNLE